MRVAWRWGNVPIPETHVAGLAVGVLLHVVTPWSLLLWSWLGQIAGWAAVLAGLVLAGWAVVAVADADLRAPRRLVTGGPYAYGRNPMYVAWTAIYVGVAAAVNTAWPLALLPVVLLVTHIAVVREERHLERRFGEEYRRYKSRVRRYV